MPGDSVFMILKSVVIKWRALILIKYIPPKQLLDSKGTHYRRFAVSCKQRTAKYMKKHDFF